MRSEIDENEQLRGLTAHGSILVTGAAGYVGGHLVRRLKNAGLPVVAHARRMGTGIDRAGDLSSPGACADAVVGCAAVVHCAARVRDGLEGRFLRDNVEATRALADAAGAAGVRRLVYLSSIVVYGMDAHFDTPETAPMAPASGDRYAASKAEAERALSGARVPLVILRPGIIWGGPDNPRFGSMLAGLKSGLFAFPGRCDAPLPFNHVDNLCDLIERALSSDVTGVFNATDGDRVSMREFAQALARHHGHRIPERHIPQKLLLAGLSAFQVIRNNLAPSFPMALRTDTVKLMNTPCTFDITEARRQLGHAPVRREHLAQARR